MKLVNEFTDGYYVPREMPILYNKLTAEQYDVNLTVKEADIQNGTEILLI